MNSWKITTRHGLSKTATTDAIMYSEGWTMPIYWAWSRRQSKWNAGIASVMTAQGKGLFSNSIKCCADAVAMLEKRVAKELEKSTREKTRGSSKIQTATNVWWSEHSIYRWRTRSAVKNLRLAQTKDTDRIQLMTKPFLKANDKVIKILLRYFYFYSFLEQTFKVGNTSTRSWNCPNQSHRIQWSGGDSSNW